MTIKRTLKFFIFVLGLMMAVYLFFQVYNAANPVYKTAVALEYTVSDSVRCKGIAVRDEITMVSGSDTSINYLVSNGEKVAMGSDVAEIYASSDGALNALIEQTLTKEAETYAEFSPSFSGNIESVMGSLQRRIKAVSAAVSGGDYVSLEDAKKQLTEQLAVFLSTSGTELNFTDHESELLSQVEQYSAGTEPIRYITAAASGYFFSDVDGYEDTIGTASLTDMTAEQLISVVNGAAPAQVSGKCKIIDGYTWYFAAVVDAEYVSRFKVGSILSLDFKHSAVTGLDMVVENVILTADSKQAVIVFSSDYLNGDIAALRVEEVDISFRNYTGIRVERGALKMDNGEFGVYVKYGTSVVFKKVDVAFETDDYIISKNDPSDPETVKLYDEIITEGKELYVGKEL